MVSKRFIAVCLVTSCLNASIAYAQVPSARDTYHRGKTAYDSGDFEKAARAFAEADSMSPNDIVLEFAIASASRADDPALGMELVERADSRGLAETARAGRAIFEKRAGVAVVRCPEDCNATLDGIPLRTGKRKWIRAGEHDASLEINGATQHVAVRVGAGETTEIRPPPELLRAAASLTPHPAPALAFSPVPAARTERAISPAWFWTGAVTTAVLGGATVVSGIDTVSINDRYQTERDAGLADRGRAAETRTNVLLISTGVAAIVTATIGYFVFRSRETEGRHASR